MRKPALGLLLLFGLGTLGVPPPLSAAPPRGKEKEQNGEALERLRAMEKRFPKVPLDVMKQWDAVKKVEMERWRERLPGQGQVTNLRVGEVKGQPWVNIGPTDNVFQYNGDNYPVFDTGRPTTIVADPRDPNVVYYAASSGGLWKTFDFVSAAPDPTWIPVTDGLPEMAVGALALDPQNPDVLYVGSGDPYDSFTGGTIYKSTDGGATWSAPMPLIAKYAFRDYRPNSVRSILVDPKDSKNVFAATRAGLFRSTDGGTSFTWINLPNGMNSVTEATWSVVYLGERVFLVSGVSACATDRIPPGVYGSSMPSMSCPLGAVGDLWRSTDGGATWTSLRNTAGALPARPAGDDFSRVTLAAGSAKAMANSTVVYAYVGNAVLSRNKTLGFWRSKDGGQTFEDATGTLANPTMPSLSGRRQCGDMNLGHDQTWYNQAIAVNPKNDDQVIAGGNLCGVRTLNGTAASPVWENISHWLPNSSETSTTLDGPLPYVHADWHYATVSAIGTEVRVFSGNDGGIYSSTNVFDPRTKPTKVSWQGHNRGIVTHLMYAVGSGDPTWGNGLVALTGLQDNGTIMRWNPARPAIFYGVQGGDGIGAAVNKGTAGEFYWISTQYGHYFCVANMAYCLTGSSINWWYQSPIPDANDDQVFLVAYAPILSDPTGVGFLTNTMNRVWRTQLAPGDDPYDCSLLTGECKLSWKPVSPDFSTIASPNGPNSVERPISSRTNAQVYGAVLDGQTRHYALTSDGGANWTFTKNLPDDGKGHTLIFPSSMDFPPKVAAGKNPGDELVVTSSAPYMNDGITVVPDNLGHIFKSSDRGQTWTPINGAGGASPLPNVPIYVVRFDPTDEKTIYVGTLIGVYATTDGGATWERFGNGLPMVQVNDMFVAKNGDFLRIATYGRGLWEVYPTDQAPMGARGNGDYDRNLQLDWVDLAAMASRMGTTPGSKTPPLYTYIADVATGPLAAGMAPKALIDDHDLSALLARMGNHP